MIFFNSKQKNMNFNDVIFNIKETLFKNPDDVYRFAVGTDSQVRSYQTCFVSAIHLHRVGYGAWCCITKQVVNRRFCNLKEKIGKETLMTYELVCSLNENIIDVIYDLSDKSDSFDINLEAHIDIGKYGETRKLIREMVGYFEGTGVQPLIKPYSYAASSYADRFSKKII